MAVILIVDDKPINREFVATLLGYAGHQTYEASDGVEALEQARKVDPDLIITDILMPTMDGVEFTHRLSAEPALAGIPVIFYTATYRLSEASDMAASCGVTVVIPKPSDPQQLLDAVHGELGITPLPEPAEAAPANRLPALPIDRIRSTSTQELTGLQMQLRATLEVDDTPSGKARQLKVLSSDLDRSVTRVHGLSMRLATLLELGVDLAHQKDPRRMLTMFCRAARDIMNARIAAVCLLQDSGEIFEFAAWGISLDTEQAVLAELDAHAGALGETLRENRIHRLSSLGGDLSSTGLARSHPPVDSILIAPVQGSSRTYGWFYVADQLGGGFEEDDEQLAQTLVAQLVPQHENLLLYDRAMRHSGLLEVEADERKRALESLRESETRFRQLAENIREVFFLMEVETGAVLYVSPTYEEVWHKSRETLYAHPTSWLNAVHPDDYSDVLRHYSAGQKSAQRFLYRIMREAETRWVKARTFPIRDPSGTVYRVAGVVDDITESVLQEERIERLSRIRAVLSGINSAIVRIRERSALLDEGCRIAAEHGGFALAWIGLVQPKTSRIEFVAYRGIHGPIADKLSSILVDDAISKKGPVHEVLRSKTHAVYNEIGPKQGESRVFELARRSRCRSAIALPLLPDGEPAGVMLLFSNAYDFFDDDEIKLLDELAGDISFALEYIAREEELQHLAHHDPLTDLPNSTLFRQRLDGAIEHAPDGKVALFLIDLDRFRLINDTLGRNIGDQLLINVGKRLKDACGTQADLARIGADDFAVGIPNIDDDMTAGVILREKIVSALSKPFQINGNELRLSCRVGVSIYPDDGGTADVLLTNAEAALKEAKSWSARYMFYSAKLNERVAERLALEQQLLAAVERREFVLHYQSKVDSASDTIVGLEALLRWNRPGEGLVTPASFITALEDTEIILDVGRWVLEQALEDHKRWLEKGLVAPRVSVNVSPLQLRYSDFPDMVTGAIERHGVTGEALGLEITEGVIMADIEASIAVLETLAERNVMISVDDFGTGYSSLRYLAKLPVDELKIDRSFITTMTSDADTMTLVSTIIGLAHSFKLKVVAEGVETDEQAKFLRLMKCDIMQGYLFSHPLPAVEIEELLARSPR